MPTTRRNFRLAPVIVSAVGVLLVGGLAACTRSTESVRAAPESTSPSTVGTEVRKEVPEAASAAQLVDPNGHPISLADLRGKIVVLTDFLTLCQEICPLTSVNFAAMTQATLRAGVSDQVEFVELTVDPERDTPERLRAYQSLVGTAANWALLTGSVEATAAVWQSLGVDYERTPIDPGAGIDWWTKQPLTYDVAHTDALIFIDADGVQRHVVVAAPDTDGRTLPPDLDAQLNAQGRENLLHPDPDAWTVPQALDILSSLLGTKVPAA